jgi:hypothetical protein
MAHLHPAPDAQRDPEPWRRLLKQKSYTRDFLIRCSNQRIAIDKLQVFAEPRTKVGVDSSWTSRDSRAMTEMWVLNFLKEDLAEGVTSSCVVKSHLYALGHAKSTIHELATRSEGSNSPGESFHSHTS